MLFFFLGFSQNIQENLLLKEKIDSINNLEFQYIISHSRKCIKLFSENITKSKQTEYKTGLAKSLSLLSLSYYYLGKYDSSFYYSLKSIKIFEELESFKMAGNEYAELGYRYKRINIENAFLYMKKGIYLLETNNDTSRLISAYNNIGYVYELNNDKDSALSHYLKSLKLARIINNKIDISYALMSIAGIDMLKNNYKNAEQSLFEAMNIRIELKDKTGIAETYAAFGELYFNKNMLNKAILYFKKSLNLSKELNYLYYKQYCFEKLSLIFEKKRNYEEAFKYHKQYIEIKDSIFSNESNKEIHELEIEFRTEKKEKEIALQKIELKENELKIKEKNHMLFLAFILVIFIASIFYLVYKNQKHTQKKLINENKLKEQLSQAKIKERILDERHRISRDLHDNLGSYLTFIISSIENLLFIPNLKNEVLIQKLRGINEFAKMTISEFRDTIWALNKSSLSINEFIIRVVKFCDEVKNINSDIEFNIINMLTNQYNLSFAESINLYRCIQEAINNSIKHSGTEKIDIRFDNEILDTLKITILDKGQGFDKEKITYGNGINNLKKRVSDINGEINIKSDNGTKIIINLKKKIEITE